MPQPGLTPRKDLTEQAAAEFVQGHGSGALAILGERAGIAEELGHRVAAKAWREMADAAARLLRSARSEAMPWRTAPDRVHCGSSFRAAAGRR